MKKAVKWILAVMASITLLALVPAEPVQASEDQNLYCLYNPVSGEYLYTIDVNEKENLESSWIYEGVVCYMPVHSGTATYRLYDAASSKHLYTSDEAEISKLEGEGWTREGVAYFVDEAKKAPVYRFFNLATGDHAFGGENVTADMEQKGWVTEGVAYYASSVNNSFEYTTNDGSFYKGGAGASSAAANQNTGNKAAQQTVSGVNPYLINGAGYPTDPAIFTLPVNQVVNSYTDYYSDGSYVVTDINMYGMELAEHAYDPDGTIALENLYLFRDETWLYREMEVWEGRVIYDIVYGDEDALFFYSELGGKDG